MLEQFFNGKMSGGGSLVLEDLNVTSHTTQSHTHTSPGRWLLLQQAH